MSDLHLTVACHLNDRTRALHDGTVSPPGIDLNALDKSIEEAFWRMSQFKEFDAAEASMSTYIVMCDQGNDDFVGIPVFPSRFFRHSSIYVNTDAGIEEPEDLKGRSVGIPEYQQTATLWIRGMLQHDYGVHPSDLHWYQGGLTEPGRTHMVDLDIPDEVNIESVPDKALSDMVETGEIDALLTARAPPAYESDSVERLFPKYWEVEQDYFARTGYFPIMHTIVLRKEIYETNKWIARELVEAFEEAKNIGLERLGDSAELTASLPWLHPELERMRDLMGDDYWPYGVKDNRETLEAMTQYAHEQGLTDEKVAVKDLFPESTYVNHKV